MTRSNIFISYSHKDEEYKNKLIVHLKSLQKTGLAHIWDASTLSAGENWKEIIKDRLNEAEIAILLISPDLLASEYISEHEFPLLFHNEKVRKTIILPILIRPTHWLGIPKLAEFQFLNDVRTPLSESGRIDEEFAAISQKIIDVVHANQSKARASELLMASLNQRESYFSTSESNTEKAIQQIFLSHSKKDGDFAELMKLRLEKEGISAWIDNDRLEPGVDWRKEIDDSIKNSKSLIVIMSPEARESEYVTYEWAYAWGVGIRIIPVMLRETPLHPRLASLHYLDFTNRKSRPWEELIKSIMEKA